jgi:lipoprotein-releasing system permease protein
MMIIDKRNNLKTLLNLGAEIKDLRKIFVIQGFLLSTFGLVVGLILGMILVYIQDTFHLFMISFQLAYPVTFKMQNILIVVGTMFVLGYLAALISSSRISEKMLN